MQNKMSNRPSTSKVHIIPIEMEVDDPPIKEKEKTKKKPFIEQPSTSRRQRSLPSQQVEKSPEESMSTCPLSLDHSYNENYGIDVGAQGDSINNEAIPRNLPMFNVKEKILFVLDSAEDENFTPFGLTINSETKPLDMLKRAIEVFIHNKHQMNKKHEYALAVMNENDVVWLVDFTNNTNKIVNALQQVKPCHTEDIFQLNSLFELILPKVEVPEIYEMEGAMLPPSYITHTILLYGRSYTMPKLREAEEISRLLKSAYFTLDVLMTHEPVDDNNNCNKIFKVLQNLDQKGFAYFFPVGRDARTLFNSMAKLLGHPLQRAPQQFTKYSIKEL